MLLPLGDDSINRRSPVVNIAIVAINLLVFALVNVFSGDVTTMKIIKSYGLVPAKLEVYQLVTCMFLHGGWLHIIGNMWFLWVFGEALENRLGHIGYAVFYLVAGIGASAFYLLLTPKTMMPCVGASGAIFGVVGAYALLYPRNQVKMLFCMWFGIMAWARTFHVSAMWIIGFWFAEQVGMWYLMSEIGNGLGGVAYAAHVGGAVVGGLIALGVRSWVPERSLAEDIWSQPGHTGGVGGGWAPPGSAFTPAPSGDALRPMMVADPAPSFGSSVPGPVTGAVDEGPQPPDEVARALQGGDVTGAQDLYRQHVSCRPGVPLAASTQIAVADSLFDRAEFPDALDAYRLFLESYSGNADGPKVKFRAAVILSRRFEQPDEASKLLLEVVMEHPDPEVVRLARGELSRIRQLA